MDRKEAVCESLTALTKDDVEKAVTISSKYFGGAGVLYEKETISIVRSILEQDFTPDPDLKPSVLQPLRVVASAMELWGANELKEFAQVSGEWIYRFKPEEVIQLLYTAGLEQHRLHRLREGGTKRIEMRPGPDGPTEACLADAGRIFKIDEAPVLPHCDPGCQCSYIAARSPQAANSS